MSKTNHLFLFPDLKQQSWVKVSYNYVSRFQGRIQNFEGGGAKRKCGAKSVYEFRDVGHNLCQGAGPWPPLPRPCICPCGFMFVNIYGVSFPAG